MTLKTRLTAIAIMSLAAFTSGCASDIDCVKGASCACVGEGACVFDCVGGDCKFSVVGNGGADLTRPAGVIECPPC